MNILLVMESIAIQIARWRRATDWARRTGKMHTHQVARMRLDYFRWLWHEEFTRLS